MCIYTTIRKEQKEKDITDQNTTETTKTGKRQKLPYVTFLLIHFIIYLLESRKSLAYQALLLQMHFLHEEETDTI